MDKIDKIHNIHNNDIYDDKDNYLNHNIHGKTATSFGMNDKICLIVKKRIIAMYESSGNKNIIYPAKMHELILDIFVNNYYPDISKRLRVNSKNAAVIMGGVAFNQNIPIKLVNFLNMETDDVDLKIYTTEITPFNKKNQNKYHNTMSLFKFTALIACLYLKQILTYIINLESTIFNENPVNIIPDTIKNPKKKSGNSLKHSKASKPSKHSKPSKPSKHSKLTLKKVSKGHHSVIVGGGGGGGGHVKSDKKSQHAVNKLISYKQKFFGVLKKFKVIVQIKRATEMDTIDVTEMTYDDISTLLLPKINDPDILITTKAQYIISYSKLINYVKRQNKITFSDCKIIYPNLDYPSFYTYYFMNNKHAGQMTSLDKIFRKKLDLVDVIEMKSCMNNCKFISIKSLLIDSVLMLSYAELLLHEKLDEIETHDGKPVNMEKLILVKIQCIYKYYKYLKKFIRLHIMRKYYNNTLNKDFVEAYKKLNHYIDVNIKKETSINESDIKNIEYRKIIKDFHKSFFIDGTMINDYKPLEEVVLDYKNTVINLNKSRSLFKELEETKSVDNIDSIMVILAKPDEQFGGARGKKPRLAKNVKHLVLHGEYDYDDLELDNEIQNDASHKRQLILNKVRKMAKNEITIFSSLKTFK
jgi:hypothetical protein